MHPTRFHLPAALVATLAAALSALACGGPEPPALVRLGTLVPPPAADSFELASELPLSTRPTVVQTELEAPRIARLTVRIQGPATLARLSWRLSGERRFQPYREISFPLVPNGKANAYEVDMSRQSYWLGRVEQLRLSVETEGSEAEGAGDGDGDGQDGTWLAELVAHPAVSLLRDMSLDGENMPALPGLARLEVPLPELLPRGATLETALGLVPELRRPGVEARFRVSLHPAAGDGAGDEPGGGETVIEELLRGEEAASWRRLSAPLPESVRGGDRLILEVAATRHGEPLPEGVAFWGNPMLLAPPKPTDGQGGPPNLVIVLLDTLRADAVGAYQRAEDGTGDLGGELWRDAGITPRLDRLAAEGVRVADLTAPTPWTLPSIASLMTGLQPQTHGAGQRQGAQYAPLGVPGGARTLAEVLAARGYYTFGLYHNLYVSPAFGLHQGYDRYISFEEDAGPMVERALAEVEGLAGRPFFFYLHLFDPHNPYEPPAEECAAVARRLLPDYDGELDCSIDRRPTAPLPAPEDRPWAEALYAAEVAYTDSQVGALLDGLAALGLEEDTVLLVVGDHGEDFWDRQQQLAGNGYRTISDHGHNHFRELLHVPALLKAPGLEPAVLTDAAEMVDLFPTLLGLLGIEPPPQQGRDLLAALGDGAQRPPTPTRISDYLLYGLRRHAARRGPWKLIVPTPGTEGEQAAAEMVELELYNLDRDPEERLNVAAENPEIVAALRRYLDEETERRRKAREALLAGDDALAATYLGWNHVSKLRSLGYLD